MERQRDGTLIKKGPWTAEEDEILINFVNKFGPRDWSSIRSKGLLPRTGKSCRLRWVNKLTPNLKTRCKFTAEEERVVIELQAQFGNKWAKIATYLPGRTDNDVKNFWSTRRKRLERMLKNPSPKSQRNKGNNIVHELPFTEVPESSTVSVEKSSSSSFGSNSQDFKMMVPLPDHVMPRPSFADLETNIPLLDASPIQILPSNYDSTNFPFSLLPPPPQLDITTLLPDCPVPAPDHYFLDTLGNSKLSLMSGLPLGQVDLENPLRPDSFFDDFPADMFDYLEPLPSPPDW